MSDTITSLTSVIAKSSSESGSHSSGAVNKTYHYMHIVIFIFMAIKILDNGKQNISDRIIHYLDFVYYSMFKIKMKTLSYIQ